MINSPSSAFSHYIIHNSLHLYTMWHKFICFIIVYSIWRLYKVKFNYCRSYLMLNKENIKLYLNTRHEVCGYRLIKPRAYNSSIILLKMEFVVLLYILRIWLSSICLLNKFLYYYLIAVALNFTSSNTCSGFSYGLTCDYEWASCGNEYCSLATSN